MRATIVALLGRAGTNRPAASAVASDVHAAPRRTEWMVIALICVVVGWFDVWTVRSSADPWRFGREQKDYYNLLLHGWLHGQLAMQVDVPDALLKLADPYDPRTRPPGLALHDASFFRRKYYLYFGVAPVVVLLLPFRLVTGIDLPLPVAEILFVYAGFLASVAILLGLRRRYFPEAGTILTAITTAALGVVSLGPMLLRRPHVWELPIGAGYCFAMLALLGLFCALHGPEEKQATVPRAGWLGFAATCLGLAIASRPTYLFGLPVLVVPLAWAWFRDRRFPWRSAVAGAVPVACIGLLLAWHNYARFGNPLEFGQRYQLSLDYESKMAHFSPRYLAYNLKAYFFSAAHWSRYFPFIRPPVLPPKPPGMGGDDGVCGVLTNLPFLWLALAVPWAVRRRDPVVRATLTLWLVAAGVLFLTVALVVTAFFGTIARYLLDFTPTLTLLAAVGAFSIEREARAWRAGGAGWVANAGWFALAAFSIVFGALFSIQLNRFYAERNLRGYQATARLLNHVPAWFESAVGVRHGGRELELRLPAGRAGREETLLTLGDAPDVDQVFIRHLDSAHLQLGFARAAMPDVQSDLIAADFAKPHRVRIVLGGLLPPPTHPWFGNVPPDVARRASRAVQITWDGETVVRAFRRFDSTVGGRVRIGEKSLGTPERPRFSGAILAARQVELNPAEIGAAPVNDMMSRAGDSLKLKIVFPSARPDGSEPLIVTGGTGQGDVFGVEYQTDGRLRFLLDHWGSELLRSEPVRVAPGVEHELRVQLPALAAPANERVEQRGELRVLLDGNLVWQQQTMGFLADPEEIAIGTNPIGGSNCGPAFSGRIVAVERQQ